MNMRIAFVWVVSAIGCGGDEPAPVAQPDAAPAAETASIAPTPWREAMTDADYLKFGERVFMAKGSNTCNDCHGKDGKKGRLEQAADLTQPDSWDVTKALAGDTDKIDTALKYLIRRGGKKFNESFVKDNPDLGWDWAKTNDKSYDIQMFGVTQSSTMSELKKIRKGLKKAGIEVNKDDLAEFGTIAVLTYVRSLSSSAPAK